jgi:hypothetical protein
MLIWLSPFLYGSEIWTHRKKDEKDWRHSRRNFTLFEHKRKEGILEEMKVEPLDEKLRRNKSSWLRHATRMNKNRVTKITLNFRPNGKKTTWKTYEEYSRRGRNRYIEA